MKMGAIWQLQDAKARFSELVEKSLKEGPQMVTKRGAEAVVVISAREYKDLTEPKQDLVSFFQSAPRIELDITRDLDLGRPVDL